MSIPRTPGRRLAFIGSALSAASIMVVLIVLFYIGHRLVVALLTPGFSTNPTSEMISSFAGDLSLYTFIGAIGAIIFAGGCCMYGLGCYFQLQHYKTTRPINDPESGSEA